MGIGTLAGTALEINEVPTFEGEGYQKVGGHPEAKGASTPAFGSGSRSGFTLGPDLG